MAEVHDMFLEGPMENGVGEWICPSCGRRLLVRRTPNFEKVVLSSGNGKANHVSIIGDKRIINVAVTDGAYETDTDSDWLTANGMSW
jgi:hypothetical protein